LVRAIHVLACPQLGQAQFLSVDGGTGQKLAVQVMVAPQNVNRSDQAISSAWDSLDRQQNAVDQWWRWSNSN
jgi:hypothetical protein